MKRKILTTLRAAEDHVSGQQLCDVLGVSRTAVWKNINALKAEGYQIEAVQNRGYRLLASPDVLTEAEVGSRRSDRWKDAPLVVYSETDSTNIQANRMAEEGAPEGTLVVADVQTSGKGRRGRSWVTPSGVSLAMSFVLRPAFAPERASMLTLVAAVACRRAVAELTGADPLIKWPNDIVLNRKKLCGILTEMKLEEQDIRQVVVGIGFNVCQEHFEGELEDKATSILMETGQHISRAELCCRVMKHFGELYGSFCEVQDLSFLQEEYDRALISHGQEVRVLAPAGEWTGVSQGIDVQGSLQITDAEGNLRSVNAGEVSVRGLYSYT